jgi:hypothetical protein
MAGSAIDVMFSSLRLCARMPAHCGRTPPPHMRFVDPGPSGAGRAIGGRDVGSGLRKTHPGLPFCSGSGDVPRHVSRTVRLRELSPTGVSCRVEHDQHQPHHWI